MPGIIADILWNSAKLLGRKGFDSMSQLVRKTIREGAIDSDLGVSKYFNKLSSEEKIHFLKTCYILSNTLDESDDLFSIIKDCFEKISKMEIDISDIGNVTIHPLSNNKPITELLTIADIQMLPSIALDISHIPELVQIILSDDSKTSYTYSDEAINMLGNRFTTNSAIVLNWILARMNTMYLDSNVTLNKVGLRNAIATSLFLSIFDEDSYNITKFESSVYLRMHLIRSSSYLKNIVVLLEKFISNETITFEPKEEITKLIQPVNTNVSNGTTHSTSNLSHTNTPTSVVINVDSNTSSSLPLNTNQIGQNLSLIALLLRATCQIETDCNAKFASSYHDKSLSSAKGMFGITSGHYEGFQKYVRDLSKDDLTEIINFVSTKFGTLSGTAINSIIYDCEILVATARKWEINNGEDEFVRFYNAWNLGSLFLDKDKEKRKKKVIDFGVAKKRTDIYSAKSFDISYTKASKTYKQVVSHLLSTNGLEAERVNYETISSKKS